MTNVDYNDGKIHGWNGGACPVHPKSRVKVWCRDGHILNSWLANDITWVIDPDDRAQYNVIAFCVVSPYKEPKTIWVNEGFECHAYLTEKLARQCISITTKRVAVKYQEVIE